MSGGLPARLARLFRPGPAKPAPAAAAPPVSLFPQLQVRTTEPAAPARAGTALFGLSTARGSWVCVAPGSGALGVSATLDTAHAAFAIIPDDMPHACLLVAGDLRTLMAQGDAVRGMALSALVLRTDASGIVRLRFPLGRAQFLTVRDPGPGATSPELRFAGDGNTQDATFKLLDVPEARQPAGLRAVAAEIGAACAGGLRAGVLLDRLRAGTLRDGLAEALVRVMPEDELAQLARRLLEQAADLAVLRRAMPGDPWLGARLPGMAAWLTQGRPAVAGHTARSPASDETLLLPAMSEGTVPAGLALHCLARRCVLPRRGACILATARDEGPYLLDWLSYHLSIGFEHVFLYTNDNTDWSDALLALLARHGVITLVDNTRGITVGPQLKAYTHALTTLPQILDFRWTAVLDIDEFLGFDARLFGGVGDLVALQETQPVDAIALSWLMFGAAPGERWSGASSLQRFTRRTASVNPHVKSLFRTRKFWHTQPHFPTPTLDAAFLYREEHGLVHHHPGVAGRIAAFAEKPSADQAWINHYFLRTADEALWKWQRGRADWLERDMDAHLARFQNFVAEAFLSLAQPENQVEDRRILACAGGQADALARLRALPGVAEADDALQADFAGRLERNTAAFLAARLAPDAPEAMRHFRELLADGRTPPR